VSFLNPVLNSRKITLIGFNGQSAVSANIRTLYPNLCKPDHSPIWLTYWYLVRM